MDYLKDLTLSKQFALTGSIVMLAGMLVMGLWVSKKIEENVTDNAGISTALFMDRFIAPLAQELDSANKLSIGPIRALNEMMASDSLKNRVLLLKIWKQGGLIAYSDKLELVGKKFTPSKSLKNAWKGLVVAEFSSTSSDEDHHEKWGDRPILEIYSPIRERWSGKIIAVAEFYEDASALNQSLLSVRRKSWLVVGALMLALSVSLFGIVHRGSKLIENQRISLQNKIVETERISSQNKKLKQRVERASSRYSQLNEKYLRRIGAELHDGPAQLLALASLRLDSLSRSGDVTSRNEEAAVVRQALDDAMLEIRNICKGLSLPEIENETLGKAIKIAVFAHEQRTGTKVSVDLSKEVECPDSDIPKAVKICVYRFVQEGLNNAYYHAGGFGQKINAAINSDTLQVELQDSGNKSDDIRRNGSSTGLGLAGLQERVESLGGDFSFNKTPGKGSILLMTITLGTETYDA